MAACMIRSMIRIQRSLQLLWTFSRVQTSGAAGKSYEHRVAAHTEPEAHTPVTTRSATEIAERDEVISQRRHDTQKTRNGTTHQSQTQSTGHSSDETAG